MPTVETNGIRTHYERRGDGPPVVFVHGAAVDGAQWTPQAAALADDYTTITYDVRGHGRTGGSAVDPYSIDRFSADLEALVSELGLDRPVVCGLSMGGCIAQAYAARYPERIRGLVLADTFAPVRLDWRDRLAFLGLRATIPPVRLVGYERVERWMVRLQELIQGDGVSGDYAAIERLRAAGPRMANAEFAKVIRAIASFHEADVNLAAVDVPVLLLCGEHDGGFIRRHTWHLAAELPRAAVRVVPDAGHASNLDNPAWVTTALREYLADRPL